MIFSWRVLLHMAINSRNTAWHHFLCSSFLPLICFVWQVVEDGYEFFAKRQLVTLFSAPNYCGEFDNAGGMMSVDETLMCSFQVKHTHTAALWFLTGVSRSSLWTSFVHTRCSQILKPSEKKAKYQYGGMNSGRPVTPPRTATPPKKRWMTDGTMSRAWRLAAVSLDKNTTHVVNKQIFFSFWFDFTLCCSVFSVALRLLFMFVLSPFPKYLRWTEDKHTRTCVRSHIPAFPLTLCCLLSL